MGRFSRWGLPLLAKELIELSTHKRTYLVRVLYAIVLMVVASTILFRSMPGPGLPSVASLGSGFPVFYWMYYLQRQAMFLLLPIVSCGAFTTEKERNTLGLLFLTQLGPWTIIFEKLLSRLLLALFFLGISLPVMSFAYALGGVSIDDLVVLFYSQLITAIRIIAISLLCSAYCRTTFGALLSSYVVIYLVGVLMSPLAVLLSLAMNGTLPWSQAWLSLARFPLYVMFYDPPPLGIVSAFRGASSNFPRTLVASVPALLVSTVSLLLARRYLVSRAFATPSDRLRKILVRIDQFFLRLNQNRWTRGIVLTREDHGIPDQDPVAWRETHTRSLGQVRYLVRWLLAIELPILLTLWLVASGPSDRNSLTGMSTFFLMLFWIILLVLTCVCSAGLISRERRQQTLDVLLTTPLHGREIIEQKMAGLRRMIWVCEIPMWTCLGFYMAGFHDDEPFALQFIFSQASMLLVYPWLVAWIAMDQGLRCKTAVMALLRTLLSCTLRCAIPVAAVATLWFIHELSWVTRADYESNLEFRRTTAGAMLFSPATLFAVSLDRSLTSDFHFFNQHGLPYAWLPNAAIHATILYWLKNKCLSQADELLGRTPELPAQDAAVETA